MLARRSPTTGSRGGGDHLAAAAYAPIDAVTVTSASAVCRRAPASGVRIGSELEVDERLMQAAQVEHQDHHHRERRSLENARRPLEARPEPPDVVAQVERVADREVTDDTPLARRRHGPRTRERLEVLARGTDAGRVA